LPINIPFIFRLGLVHIKTHGIKVESGAVVRIVDRFDFEDAKTLVSLRMLDGARLVTLAYADLTIGNGGRSARLTASR